MINQSYNLNLNEENLFHIEEFTVSGTGRIDILFITSYADIIVIELKIKDNISSRDPLEQILGYVRGIRTKIGDNLITNMKVKKPKQFENFICCNKINEKCLSQDLSYNLSNRKILALLIFNKLDENLVNKFDKKIIEYKDEISRNLILTEMVSFRLEDELSSTIVIPCPQRKICFKFEASIQNKLTNLDKNLSIIIDDLYRKNCLLDTLKSDNHALLELFNSHVGTESQMITDNESLIELIKNEGVRLNASSFLSLFDKISLDKKIPSRSHCYKLLGQKVIREITKFFKCYAKNSKKDIINFLRDLSSKLGRSPSSAESTIRGRHVNTICSQFKTYNNALKAAGLNPVQEHTKPSKDEIITEIKSISKLVKRHIVREYISRGGHYYWYLHYLGSFKKALISCGVIPFKS
ncbi:hypothetical protein LL033_09985 [Clostridium estertheticum]|uniref:homing endonuclease associated repeat-containing protein n=1 Tax=Clostridium estertheticum TaxID=238834 RepID=UPI001C0E7214|nr:hypothetical protein [Clostridium estertheticum]MBU3217798.1 hypothetical protein [Clostridium estertheticum]WAG57485.1 hypothetical protein LL033_09985 [Clostridium estertheticum]